MDTVELTLVWQNAAAAANKLWTMAKKQQQNPAQLTEELHVKGLLGVWAPTPTMQGETHPVAQHLMST